ncbi:MAG: biosynthetic-type acetolactate synthase large subunit [Clostridia bacterium]|nr:biosynthetic-type acetolactate synthase large subunit [Clostridia bacterium]
MEKKRKRKMKGAELLVAVLEEQGVTDVFGYPGGQVLYIYDALYAARKKIRHILTAHEQGAAHAADGYARVTGKVGVVIATSGPGATNLVTGIATAMLDSVPMVAITGNVPTTLIGRDAFQEINITGVTMPITKHNYFVQDVNELADTVREAFMIAKSGRPGPVLIDVPKDVQCALCEYERSEPVGYFEEDKADEADIEAAAKLINEAKRPYIYIGGGAAGAGIAEKTAEFAELTDAYIGCSFMGLSALPDGHARFLGMEGMHGRYASTMANKEADLIIGIGVRFSDRATGKVEKYAKRAKIIQLDTDLSEINKNVQVDVGIVGNLRDSFARLFEKCEKADHPEWRELVSKLREEEKRIEIETEERSVSKTPPKKIFEIINKYKSEDDVICTDVGQHQMWCAQNVRFSKPRRFASSGGLGTMGYGLGAAIGAVTAGNKRAVLITGDGSFAMNCSELATAVTYGMPIAIVLFDNGVLGMVRQMQTLFFGKRYSNTVLERKTDFVKLAEAYGAKGERVTDVSGFEKAFSAAMKYKGPYVIDVVTDKDELVLPMMPPGGSIDDLITEIKEEDRK